MTNFCKDCEYMIPSAVEGMSPEWKLSYSSCSKNPRPDSDYLVTGLPDHQFVYCSIVRATTQKSVEECPNFLEVLK